MEERAMGSKEGLLTCENHLRHVLVDCSDWGEESKVDDGG